MTPIAPEACPVLDRAKLDSAAPKPREVLQMSEVIDKRPWLATAFTALLQVQRYGRFEPGIGDFRVTDDTLNMAGRILGSIKYRQLPNPALSALPGGGIYVSWANGAEAVEVTVFPGEGVVVARLLDDVPVKTIELGAAEYTRINDFLRDFVVDI
jgi:hypothetical protein